MGAPALLALQTAVLRAVADLRLRRVITFHSRVSAARELASTLLEASQLLPDAERPERIRAKAEAGTDRLKDRRAAFAEFKAHTGEWRLDGTAGLEAAGHVLRLPRAEMGGTARGAGTSGAPHATAVNETLVAFVRGGTAPGSAGGIGLVTSWATEVEFTLPGGRRKVRPDAVLQAPEVGVPVLMVEVDRSTMAPARVAAKLTAYRELFRVKVRDNDPARFGEEPADRTVHWWRSAYPGHSHAGYPPVALVVTDAGPLALANRQEAVSGLSAECWRGQRYTVHRDDNDGDGWREYDDAVPIVATTLELLAEHGPLGPIWWRYGRPGRHFLTDALDNPDNRTAYDQRQAAREKKARRAHRELMQTLACADCGQAPKQESTYEYGLHGQRTRRPGGRCYPCHQEREERLEREAEEQLEAARTANAALRPCWRCRGSIGGEEGSKLELREKADLDRLGCPGCEQDHVVMDLGLLVLSVPTKRGLVSAPDDPWVGGPGVARGALPGESAGVTCWRYVARDGLDRHIVWTCCPGGSGGWQGRTRFTGGYCVCCLRVGGRGRLVTALHPPVGAWISFLTAHGGNIGNWVRYFGPAISGGGRGEVCSSPVPGCWGLPGPWPRSLPGAAARRRPLSGGWPGPRSAHAVAAVRASGSLGARPPAAPLPRVGSALVLGGRQAALEASRLRLRLVPGRSGDRWGLPCVRVVAFGGDRPPAAVRSAGLAPSRSLPAPPSGLAPLFPPASLGPPAQWWVAVRPPRRAFPGWLGVVRGLAVCCRVGVSCVV
ncbi:replication-relaxation family protein [Kitasatospora azatica]|uniref:replication-relaxation family protein n=1 Tax=Kitasatospora azatica TaxID=58347 RepID=UPI00068A4F4D|nr:replication-relaxation family protein [Kitasatospora azatica]